MRIFITGGTGLVGTRLVRKLLERGDQPVVLTRRYGSARQSLGQQVELVEGDPMKAGEWMDRIGSCDGVIHLAGENVFGKRWTTAFKQLLVDSRVQGTRHVAEALIKNPRRSDGQPKVLVSASAIGIYGSRGDEELTEKSASGNDFLAKLCIQWEEEARKVESAGIRAAQVRVGVVLDKEGGALAQLLPLFKMFVGGPVGSGKQYMSWVHHEDLVGLLLFALDTSACTGPLNGTAPHPVTNADFSRQLGKALGRPSFMWAPGFGLKLLLGEAAEIVTNSQKVIPEKALRLWYNFKYPTLELALAQLFPK